MGNHVSLTLDQSQVTENSFKRLALRKQNNTILLIWHLIELLYKKKLAWREFFSLETCLVQFQSSKDKKVFTVPLWKSAQRLDNATFCPHTKESPTHNRDGIAREFLLRTGPPRVL